MKHIIYNYESVIDRLFNPKWGPFTPDKRISEFKEMYKEMMDYLENKVEENHRLYAENHRLWDRNHQLSVRLHGEELLKVGMVKD